MILKVAEQNFACYNIPYTRDVSVSVFLLPQSGGDAMTVYEGLSLMIGFAILVIHILSFKHK